MDANDLWNPRAGLGAMIQATPTPEHVEVDVMQSRRWAPESSFISKGRSMQNQKTYFTHKKWGEEPLIVHLDDLLYPVLCDITEREATQAVPW